MKLVFNDIKNTLKKYRQTHPKSRGGQYIGLLAVWYDKYCRIKSKFQSKTKKITNSEIEKHLTLGVEYIFLAGVQGDIAEFGTMSGATACIIAKASVAFSKGRNSLPRNLHLFDSFAGLPIAKSPVDCEHPNVISGVWSPGLLLGLSEQQLIAKVRKSGLAKDRLKVYAGWFCDTVPELPDNTKFAMLHIDCDFYQSTMDVLDAGFSKNLIANGAIILFDDWNIAMASPSLGERRAWSEITKKYNINYSDEGSYGWNAHKFIIHSYKNGAK